MLSQDIEARITDYLSSGGLFNPELMEHEKVRDLLLDCRAALAAEREKYQRSQEKVKEYFALLAAEREKRNLVRWCVVHYPEELVDCCPACEAVHLSDQLAAEREKLKQYENRNEPE